MKNIPMTIIGSEELRAELNKLEKIDRPNVVQSISEARSHGDLKENAEYHAAREQQGFIEGRIRDIKNKLSNAQIIDISNMPNKGRVVFGSTVKLLNLENNKVVIYKIVGEDESDLKKQKISIVSPMARALIGKHLKSTIDVQAPGKIISYEIKEVKYN